MRNVLIQNADWILTMDEKDTRHRHADIWVQDNQVKEIGENLSAKLDREGIIPDEVIRGEGMIVTPGFVNTHHHSFQTLMRNLHCLNGIRLEPWLYNICQIFEGLNPDVSRAGTYIAFGELLKTGCTTSQDHFNPHPAGQKELIDAQLEAAKELGIRFHPTRGCHTIGKSNGSPHIPDTLVETTEQFLTDCERLINKYHDTSRLSMCRVGVAPAWAEFETEEVMLESLDFLRKHKVQGHTHIAESKDEFTFVKEKYNCTPVQFLERQGWLGPDLYFAHCVQFTDDDVKLFAKTQSGVAHCPVSNMFLNSGIARVPDMLEQGVKVSLGVDGSASTNSSNMMTEIRVCYLMHQLQSGVRGPTAYDVLKIATVGGAKVLNRDDIGHLAPGMAADLVLHNWNQFQYAGGMNDPAACIVLCGDSKIVHTVMVNGKVVVRGGTLQTIDEEKTLAWANKVGKKLLGDATARVPELAQDLQ